MFTGNILNKEQATSMVMMSRRTRVNRYFMHEFVIQYLTYVASLLFYLIRKEQDY